MSHIPTEMLELTKAREIAVLACEEGQPMPTEGVTPQLIAEVCEQIGEDRAKDKRWHDCANAHRMACWYYRKQLDQ